MYRIASIAFPGIPRDAHVRNQKIKQERDPRHPLYDHGKIRGRLVSEKSFLAKESLDPDQTETYQLDKWNYHKAYTNNTIQEPTEKLPKGTTY